jgi:hypothetical protein
MERLEARLLLDGTVTGGGPLAGVALGAIGSEVGALSAPPQGYSYSPAEEAPTAGGVSKVLDVPEYSWYRGCGPTSVAMILGYWDTLAYPNYFVGDASTQTANVNARLASVGHDADWWPEPDRQPPPDYHTDNSIADFFKTSRGSLKQGWSKGKYADDVFINFGNFVGYPAGHSWTTIYGYNFEWSDLVAEIDAGRPMMFLVDSDGDYETDHFIPVIGYRTEPYTQYAAYTTWSWDPGVHWFDFERMIAGYPWGISTATYFHPSYGSPDLAATDSNVTREPMVWGDSFTYEYGVKNYGTEAAGGFDIHYYMSRNETISTSDHYLGSSHVSSLGAGVSVSGSKSLALPAAPPANFSMEDDVWIGTIVDADGDVAEGVETNNRNIGLHTDSDKVRIDGKPDLVGTAFSLEYGVVNAGETRQGNVKATFTVTNAGQGTTLNGFWTRSWCGGGSPRWRTARATAAR